MVNSALAQTCLASVALLVASSSSTLAAPAAQLAVKGQERSAQSFPLARRRAAFHDLSGDALLKWTEKHRSGVRTKYASKLKGSHKKEARRKRALEERDESARRGSAPFERRDSAGSAQLVNYQQDSTFFAPVTIGTPGQTVNIVLDTGSADFWTVQGKQNWDPASSSSFQNSSKPFHITYGSGSVSGTLATDTVQLAGHTASSQTFALATQISQGLLGQVVEGIMGFAFKSLSTSGATPFWQNAGTNIFSFYLRGAAVSGTYSEQQSGGYMTLGGTNSSLYTGDVNWSSVVDETYWLITLGGITASGSDVSLDGTSKVAVDTGTTLIGAPDSVVEQIYQSVEGSQQLASGYYTFPCSTTGLNVTMHFGNQEYQLDSDQLIAGTTDSQGDTCLGSFFSFGSDSSDELQYILGDAFLKNVYTIFDNSQSSGARVGFASLASGLGVSTRSRTVNQVVATNGAAAALLTPTAALALVASLASTLAMFA